MKFQNFVADNLDKHKLSDDFDFGQDRFFFFFLLFSGAQPV